ncbi:hypothetical protein FKW77_003580 [Venturia effusa]|uniref:Uncharacterized protein n=1 Tax=Venturia effusa TaxID=50376 RepID=A0A517LPV9_9PEZI|nr:hypothetical protein FKW77_003580 [Venturia effusa]
MESVYPHLDNNTTNQDTSSSSASTSTNSHHESITESDDSGTSSENDVEADFSAQSIGVSISRQQTRLASATTPAAEKAAAMEERGGFFNSRYDVKDAASANHQNVRNEGTSVRNSRNVTRSEDTTDPERERNFPLHSRDKVNTEIRSPSHKVPSTWRTEPENLEQLGRSSATSKQGLTTSRQRSSSGTENSRMRYPAINLPSPSNSSGPDGVSEQEFMKDRDFQQRRSQEHPDEIPQSDGAPWKRESWNDLATRVRRSTRRLSKENDSDVSLSPDEEDARRDPAGPPPSATQPQPQPQHTIKRTQSHDSLLLHGTLSRVSSLGDDSRFENVSEQINSRFKAFKDSIQDANFRVSLPRPSSIFTASSSKSNLSQRSNSLRASTFNVRRSPFSAVHSSQQELSSSSDSKRGSSLSQPQRSRGSKPSAGMNMANAVAHPYLSQALEDLEGDVVILGGYRGSILREAREPHRRLWVPIKVGLNIRKVDLEVGLDHKDEERMPEKIISTGMLTHIGPVDMSKRLIKKLRACENAQSGKLRIHDYGYDWRLSPHRLSKELGRFLETLPCNAPGVPLEKRGAIVIAHSLGGLITRHVINRSPHLFAGVIFAGTPHEGCVNILGPIRNGDDVLLSSKVLTAQVNFTIRTSFALLPLDGKCFIDKDTKEELQCDFFDPQQWIEYRWSPCIAPPLPPLQTKHPRRVNSIINSMANVVPDSVIGSLPFANKRNSQQLRNGQEAKDAIKDHAASAAQAAESAAHAEGGKPTGITPQMGGNNPAEHNDSTQSSVSTHCTIPRDQALEYLTRTLKEVKAFKQELAFTPSHASGNRYPPMAVIYGKSDPTVYGARVRGRDGIKRADAYDDLAFASGDGVVLARGAMLPPGFRAVKGGVVASERGHVTLLGDLEAVGRCLNALMAARTAGIGIGIERAV